MLICKNTFNNNSSKLKTREELLELLNGDIKGYLLILC